MKVSTTEENMNYNKNVTLDVPCPECQNKQTFTLGELENNPTYICESCKNSVTVNSDKLFEGMSATFSKIEDAFKNLNFN
jgi:transposase-like protein